MARVCILTPNTLLDHLSHAAFETGRVNRCNSFTQIAGGKGLNVGRILAKHGHKVLAFGFAGGWSGNCLRSLLSAEGQIDRLTETAANTRIGFLNTDSNDVRSSLMENGFAVSVQEYQQCFDDIAAEIPNADLVICCGSLPNKDNLLFYRQVHEYCAQHETACWIDSYGPALSQALEAKAPVALVKPNLEEYSPDYAWDNSSEIHLSNGAEELFIRRENEYFHMQPAKVICKNDIGCGDSYVAGLAHARLVKMDTESQLRYACAAGTANAARADVAQIGPEDIQTYLKEVIISDLDPEKFPTAQVLNA